MRPAILLCSALGLLAGSALAGGEFTRLAHAQPASTMPGATPAAPPSEELAEREDLYKRYARHRLPARATSIIDTALDLAELRRELPQLWSELSSDPILALAWSQIKALYKPSVQWSAYAGGLAESTGYTGLTAGASLDIVAPLCRYLGAEANTHGYYQNGTGISYDTRATACLPWGPFSFEFGLLRQRQLRVGLSSAPSLPNSQYNSDGFELRIRGYRWLGGTWEGLIGPTDVIFRTFSVPDDDSGAQNSNYQIDSAFFRYLRYDRGFLGATRKIEAFEIDVTGQQDTDVAKMSATVVTVAPVKFSGARLAKDLYLNAHLAFAQGRISDLDNVEEPLANFFYFDAGAELNQGDSRYQTTLRYRRRLLPDSEFRLLGEDRIEATAQLVGYVNAASISTFGALTQQEAAPPGVQALETSYSYGVEGKYGHYLYGPFYLQLTTTGARSFYASIDGARLATPELEFRALASIIASDSSQ